VDTFARTRLEAHVTRNRSLIADRTAWNKLFRRSFWDAQGRRFPEGVLNEDIPVIVPAHFAAKSVDVISDPIYYWRIRDGEELSITQRRLEPKALHDRMAALEKVVDWLDEHGKKKWKRWYLEGVVSDDLRFYLNPLTQADDEYRQLFLDKVNDFLDRAPKGIFDRQSSIERLKWYMVRHRLMDELLEVIRFHKGEEFKETPPVEIDGRWYGDYPFRTDERLKIPSSVYLLEGELGLRAEIESLELEDGKLKVRGHAYIRGIGAAEPDTQKLSVVVLRRGPLKRFRIRLTAKKLDVTQVRRPDVTAGVTQRLRNLDWAGFEATLDPRDLRGARGWQPGLWDLYVVVRSGKTHRRRSRFYSNKLRPLRGVELPGTPAGVLAKAAPLRLAEKRLKALGFDVEVADLSAGLPDGDINGVVLQQPGASGALRDHAAVVAAAKERGVVFVPGTDFLLEGGQNSLRLAYSGVTVEQIEEGVGRLAEAYRGVAQAAA
jgi:CDP-glycerol glycerophosphotransferase